MTRSNLRNSRIGFEKNSMYLKCNFDRGKNTSCNILSHICHQIQSIPFPDAESNADEMKTLSLDMLHHFNPFPLTHGFTNSRKTQFGEEETHTKHILRALRGGRICNRLAFNNLDSENAFVLCCGAQKTIQIQF